MKIIENPIKEKWQILLQRPTEKLTDIEGVANTIFTKVKENGDKAIAKYTQKFDGITSKNIMVSTDEIEIASKNVSMELKKAIALAKSNISKFHTSQKTDRLIVEIDKGVTCWQEKRAISKVGLYIPGGTAPLFSTVLMLAVPAKIAGCKEIVLCTPPDRNGNVNPVILYAASLCGVTKILKVGGIQAIAGMTFGTESIPQVSKILGPGNQYVTVAKQLATKFGVAIDMPAGPSELLVFADTTAVPSFVASDLLSQAEHGVDSQVILISTSKDMLHTVMLQLEQQLDELPRKDIARQAISNSKFIYVDTDIEALELINEYAPEHFIICAQDEAYFIDNIENAGSVFIGNYTPESAGDYASGTNHTLPTNGFSKAYSGVNLDSFLKSITFQKISREGLQTIGNAIELMADAEGLQAHKKAVSIRLENS